MRYYPITLDKARNFKYGMKAISLMEKKFKKAISKIDFDAMTMDDVATFVWAGLSHEDKDLTPDKVMDLIDEYSDISTVMTIAAEALEESFGAKKGKSDEKNV